MPKNHKEDEAKLSLFSFLTKTQFGVLFVLTSIGLWASHSLFQQTFFDTLDNSKVNHVTPSSLTPSHSKGKPMLNRLAKLIGIDNTTATKLRARRKKQAPVIAGIECLEERCLLSAYDIGHTWDRQADWTAGTANGSTNGNPDDDSVGNPVWQYETVAGGGASANWYEQAKTISKRYNDWFNNTSSDWVFQNTRLCQKTRQLLIF